MADEMVPAKPFGVVDVEAKVSMDDLLDLKVGEYEKKLRNAAKEVDEDTARCQKQLATNREALQKLHNSIGFGEHVALANETLKCVSTFLQLEPKMFDIECRGCLIAHEKRESVVQMTVTIVDNTNGRHLLRVIVRKMTPEEKKLLKEEKQFEKAIETNQGYRLQLDKAKADIPLIRRDLKNEVTRRKLEAAGELALLKSIDRFEVPVLPKNVLSATK